MSNDSKKKYKYKKLLKKLEDIEGQGTELVSVYIPPDFNLNVVINQLKEEQGTAKNIKSKSTRKNVVSALNRMVNFLQKYAQKEGGEAPENGMAIFAGNTAEREGKSDIELYWLEPPKPIESRIYRCDKKFKLEPLKEAITEQDKVGLIALDSKEATIATLDGNTLNIVRNIESNVWSEHKKGGQSQQRFERLREEALKGFFNDVAEIANREFSNEDKLKGILLGGPGPNKKRFYREDYLDKKIEDKIISVFDIGYSNEQGIKELMNEAGDVLEELNVIKEKNIFEEFKKEIVSEEELVTYGVENVAKHLRAGAVETLLISEDINIFQIKAECVKCQEKFKKIVKEEEIKKLSCKNCQSEEVKILEKNDIIEKFCEMADNTGAEVFFISSETEEGKQFQNAFSGIGAFLRYKIG